MRRKTSDWQTDMIVSGAESKTPESTVATLPAKSASAPARSQGYYEKQKLALDRWENYQNGFGQIGTDPVASTIYNRGLQLPLGELEALYRKDWLTQRIIEALADSAFQRGFEIQSEKDPKGAEENQKLLKKWKTNTHAKHLAYQARHYGFHDQCVAHRRTVRGYSSTGILCQVR